MIIKFESITAELINRLWQGLDYFKFHSILRILRYKNSHITRSQVLIFLIRNNASNRLKLYQKSLFWLFFIRFQSQCMRIPDVCDVLSPLVQSSTRTEFLFHMLLYQNNLLLCLKVPWMILILQLRSTWEISHPFEWYRYRISSRKSLLPISQKLKPSLLRLSVYWFFLSFSYFVWNSSFLVYPMLLELYWNSFILIFYLHLGVNMKIFIDHTAALSPEDLLLAMPLRMIIYQKMFILTFDSIISVY